MGDDERSWRRKESIADENVEFVHSLIMCGQEQKPV